MPDETTPVVTSHSLNLGNTALDYTVTTGLMPLKDDKGETQAHIFYMAYVVPQAEHAAPRPLTFVFNGGPGGGSQFEHLGGFGPKRIKRDPEDWTPPPPYQLVDNPDTWLDMTDLVFIDPVGTGYSRAVKPEDGKNYWSVQGDNESLGEFIRLYLARNDRWTSPLYLCGESYGTTRAAGLSGHLIEKGIALNGIVMVAYVTDFQTLEFERGNDLPFVLFLPTYAATAWYHHKLPADLQTRPLEAVIAEVEHWATTDYSLALTQGNQLQGEQRAAMVNQLARYTGLSPRYIEQSDLRIHIMRFCKELLRDEQQTVGRFDGRAKGRDALAVTEFPEYDPSGGQYPAFVSMINHYLRTHLSYENDEVYHAFNPTVFTSWDWVRGKYVDTTDALRLALAKNPHLRVLISNGYYDLATPYCAVKYTLAHLGSDPRLQSNVKLVGYPAGHGVYQDWPVMQSFRAEAKAFFGW